MSKTEILPADDITATDHWIIGAALSDLFYKLKVESAGQVLTGRVEQLRTHFMASVGLPAHPPHVMLDETEILKMMVSLPDCDTWHVFWERDEETFENLYVLTAEIWDQSGREQSFHLVRGLIGASTFHALADDDAAFVQAVETFVIERGPASKGAQISHMTLEVPVAWDVIADRTDSSAVEEYIQNVIADDEDLGGYAVLAVYVDAHSDEHLAKAMFAGVHAVVTGLAEDLERLPAMIERFQDKVIETGMSGFRR